MDWFTIIPAISFTVDSLIISTGIITTPLDNDIGVA